MIWYQHAETSFERQNKPKMQVIAEQASGVCITGCNGKWHNCAGEVLQYNQVNLYYFAGAMRQALTKGRPKNIKTLIFGPKKCGKSFLLNPLEILFKDFVNPATGRCAWIGFEECDIAYLNDSRWSTEIIAWADFLLLSEGQTGHLKNQFATDMCIDCSNTVPFFATSKTDIKYIGKCNGRDQRECDMISS